MTTSHVVKKEHRYHVPPVSIWCIIIDERRYGDGTISLCATVEDKVKRGNHEMM